MALPTTFDLTPGKKNPAQQGDTMFLPFDPAPEWPDDLIFYENAKKLAREIVVPNGGGAFVMVSGNFIFGDFIEAFITHHNYHVSRLRIVTLSIKEDNIDSLRNLIDGDYIDALTFVLSDWEFNKHRWTLMPYMVEQLGSEGRAADGRFRFAAVRSHCKICLIETHCGRRFVLHGSANLVSSGNVEQFQIEDTPKRHDQLARYWDALADKYNRLNEAVADIRKRKPLTTKQSWQPTQESEKKKH